MVALFKELERRREKRLTRAHYIKHIRIVLFLVVGALGLLNYFLLGTIFRLEPEGSIASWVALSLQWLSVAMQLGILWLVWWSWKVIRHAGRKL